MKNQKWITLKKLKIQVQKELNPKVKFLDIKIPKGCRLMTAYEAGYIFDNIPEIKLSDNWEWIKPFSQKMVEKKRFSVVGLVSDRDFENGRLDVVGSWYDGNGYALNYRFVRD